jgi:hypothetical protein
MASSRYSPLLLEDLPAILGRLKFVNVRVAKGMVRVGTRAFAPASIEIVSVSTTSPLAIVDTSCSRDTNVMIEKNRI